MAAAEAGAAAAATYPYHTTCPYHAICDTPSPGAALAAAKEKHAKLLNSPALRAPLSSGWEEVPDPTGGPTYYYHAATGQTQWVRPEEEVSSRSSAGKG